jgi:hypothetical protein
LVEPDVVIGQESGASTAEELRYNDRAVNAWLRHWVGCVTSTEGNGSLLE